MRILILTKKFPYPVKDGEVIAIHNLAKAYAERGVKLAMLSMNTPKHFFKAQSKPSYLDYLADFQSVKVDTSIHLLDAFRNLFSPHSYHITRFSSLSFENKLREILQDFKPDFVQLETLYLAPYCAAIRQTCSAKIIMRAHNVEHEIWQRISDNTTSFLKKTYLQLLTNRLKKYELSQLKNYDLILPITERDTQYFKKHQPSAHYLTTPIGIDIEDYPLDMNSYNNPLSISFIGSLDWLPNIEGLEWFLNKVWKNLSETNTALTLHIAGRNSNSQLGQTLPTHVILHGEVEHAQTFINQHSLMVVPLLSGSGMRVKILEAMALGRVVITSSIGVEGIEAQHKKEVLIANTPQEYKVALQFCVKNPQLLPTIGKNARQLIIQQYDRSQIAQQVLALCRQYTS